MNAVNPNPHPGAGARWVKIALPVVVLAIVGFFLVRAVQPPAKPHADATIPVSAEKVGRQNVPIYRDGFGTVRAFNSVLLKVRVDGSLDKVLFDEGQMVKAGQVLAQIDPRPYQAALDQALAKKGQDESQLVEARADLVRFEALIRQQFTSQQSLEAQQAMVAQLEATVKADEAAIENARVQLSYTTIVAPISGRIGLRLVDMGNILHAVDQTGLAVISQVQPIAVTFSLPATVLPDLTKIGVGSQLPVTTYTSDGKEKLATGTLLTVDNAVDEQSGTIKLKATFANDDNRLWPGQSVSARLTLSTLNSALTIPTKAVERGPEGLFVYVVQNDSTVAVHPIETSETVGDYVVVVSAKLSEGDLVVTNGQSRLQPGAHVAVMGDRPQAPAKADMAKGQER